jgi:hypothetical protein|tara:strand:- start:490 stop:696 length:207 start_codon:yes stop_codon:yes gene_type:complete
MSEELLKDISTNIFSTNKDKELTVLLWAISNILIEKGIITVDELHEHKSSAGEFYETLKNIYDNQSNS